MSSTAQQAPPANVISLFGPQAVIIDKNRSDLMARIHYGINLTEQPLPVGHFNITDAEVINVIPPGVIFPIREFKRWDINDDFKGEEGGIVAEDGRILRKTLPGYIANFLDRQFGIMGLGIIRSATGVTDEEKIIQVAELYNFGFTDPESGEATRYPNRVIREKVLEIQKKYRGDKLICSIGDDVIASMLVADAWQRKQLSDRHMAIVNKVAGTLDPAHYLMCRMVEVEPSKFEVDFAAQSMASNNAAMKFFETFAEKMGTAMAPQQPPQAAPPGAPSYADLFTMLQKQGEMLAKQGEVIGELQKQLKEVKKDKKEEVK
jgi:hypothetical protein